VAGLGRLGPRLTPQTPRSQDLQQVSITGGGETKRVWKLALLMGLITSTFSTLVIVLGSPRIGRGVALSWMEVGTVVLGGSGVKLAPGLREIVAGIVVHQSADIFWALVFFGLASRWTLYIRPAILLLLAPLWAVATSLTEYYLVLPWLQPLLRIQSPYWINLVVHMSSAAAYPIFLWLRKPLTGEERGVKAGRRTAFVLAGVLAVLGALEVLSASGHEFPSHLGGETTRGYDRSFMRRMAAHHEVGVVLARVAAERGTQKNVRVLGRMMVAEQEAEIRILRHWWWSWYGQHLPRPSPREHATMPGMTSPEAIQELAQLRGRQFEKRFYELMLPHHWGAVKMAINECQHGGDPRLCVFADQIRHAQIQQIERMEFLQNLILSVPGTIQ
jgi:uncharacterized protein (DUF305 family)